MEKTKKTKENLNKKIVEKKKKINNSELLSHLQEFYK